MIIEIIAGFELGIGALIASIPTYLFIRNYFDYIVAIPFAVLLEADYYSCWVYSIFMNNEDGNYNSLSR